MATGYVDDTGVFARCGGQNWDNFQRIRRAHQQTGGLSGRPRIVNGPIPDASVSTITLNIICESTVIPHCYSGNSTGFRNRATAVKTGYIQPWFA